MAEEIAVENGRISKFEGLVTLTLDRVILHTVMYQTNSTRSTYIPISLKSKILLVDGRMHGQTYETDFIRSTPSKTEST